MAPARLPPFSGFPPTERTRSCNSRAPSRQRCAPSVNIAFRLASFASSAAFKKPFSPSLEVSMSSFKTDSVSSFITFSFQWANMPAVIMVGRLATPHRPAPDSGVVLVLRLSTRCGRRPGHRAASCGNHAPYGVADVVSNQQRAFAIDGDANRPAERVALRVDEARQHVFRKPRRPAIGEGHEDDFVAA